MTDSKGGDMATRNPPTAFRVQKFLAGLRYPACKPEIIDWALHKGADEETMRALLGLPERDYESPISLSTEFSRS
jgi:hypothetical protein